MPILDSLPNPDTIRRMKGRLDYYVWKDLAVVRKWPITPRSHLTPGTIAQSARYSEWLRKANNTDSTIIEQARALTRGTNWTWRDFICFAIAGNLYNP